ncbi:MAG: tRNA lysidine(34) synthetase TilS [Phycisphaerales bacterium]|nr:tRNA lysidine(34) synthetase TilS [Phycisphaerales bacterium]
MNLPQRLEQHWQAQQFPDKKEKILLALSGGKDSMTLASLLHQIGCNLAVAHCNFMLRGTDSDLDEQLVKDWATQNNILCHCISFDTKKEMARNKTGVQETARKLRYDWFSTLCKEHHYAAIATAHHANDNVETLLINLCKGTGIAGLHGIPAKNNNIIRPLLFATRAEITEYATEHQIPFSEDASNSSTQYLRNAVRHKILPVLNEIFPDVVTQINQNIERFKQVENIYELAIAKEKKKLMERRGNDYYIPILKLLKRPSYKSICFEIFKEFGFSSAQVPEILKLLKSESGHYLSSESHRVIRNRMFLIITELISPKTDFIIIDKIPCSIKTSEGQFNFNIVEPTKHLDESKFTAYLNLDTLKLPLIVRRWRIGDYFYPLGMGMKKKKISRFLIDQKVPIHEKEKVWIIESQQKIAWLAAMRIDERFKIKNDTKKLLKINFLAT